MVDLKLYREAKSMPEKQLLEAAQKASKSAV